MKCPECSTWLGKEAESCDCGWKARKPLDVLTREHFCCANTNEKGERCAALGRFTASTKGSERWYCEQHFAPFKAREFGKDRALPPDGFFKRHGAHNAAALAEDLAERLAIQQEGSA